MIENDTKNIGMNDCGMSVVIPVKNREGLIVRCLDSVKAQTWRPVRVIVVDNGSTDRTAPVVKEWIEANKEVEFSVKLVDEQRPGAACARNRGLMEVDTEYVLFFDSDDAMAPDLIENAMSAFCNDSAVDLVHWRTEVIYPDGSVKKRKFNPGNYWRYHIYHALLGTLCYAARTSFFRKAGGWDNSLTGWDDWEAGIRILLANPAIVAIDRVLAYIYPQAESITGTDFHSKAGEWERAIDRAEEDVACSGRDDAEWIIGMINYRRAILASHYEREKRHDLAAPLLERALRHSCLSGYRRWLLKMLYHYTAIGGRGAYMLWT